MKRIDRWILLSLFVVVFAAPFAYGFYQTVYLNYMHSDAMSRVANAFYVMFSRDPHLAAIGFVWNPLPSLANMLFLTLYPVFPVMATHGVAGVLMSCTFTALTAVYLYHACHAQFKLKRGISVAIALLFSFNPLTFYFGFTGLSDAPFNLFIMMTVVEFAIWMSFKRINAVIVGSFALALAFWTRYEAVPLGAAVAVGIVLVIAAERVRRLGNGVQREHLNKMEGTLILFLMPAVVSGLLWIWFNYIIMDNPFYFLNSEYSNQAQMATFDGGERLFSDPLYALGVVMEKSSYFGVLFYLLLLLRLFEGRLFRKDVLIMALTVFSIPALQYLLVLQESSFVWFRYFSYVFPITVAWLPYEISQARARTGYVISCMGALLISAVVLGYALSQPQIAPDEYTTITRGAHTEQQTRDRALAAYLDEHYPDATIMVDSYSAYLIIVSSEYPRKFFITSDYKFKASISAPWEYGVDYILLPRPRETAPMSILNSVYPNFFANGSEFSELVYDVDGEWRLYRIIDPSGKDEEQ